ncbi:MULTISPECIES: glucosyl-dolichyl phosphate glucuronosyltransferase [Halomicrobium]|uniref:Glycosyl transferase family 2 n=2 Tax=Halomicrobium mukohataei TaxID=57705 RepID=C7P066_HALMD|nr:MULTISPECIES: glucosyl-dolichyl phosphate glucuronosyltransferase [Halomicrobium]ACV48858.1 glycosyl transferase family 2 [Halomicrobium mukohataei DSM 12286]QCD64287.1 glycosyltransferase family 2 protein [Halomicrobium mukohataei]QFR19093.1 glycosyltransferase [Halomicrobium sp. ZPS1]
MRVSVVICLHTMDRFDHFVEAVESVFAGTYDDVELVLVSDGSDAVCGAIEDRFGDRADVQIVCNEENRGLAVSRNRGLDAASGDVVAFTDDDVIADERWLEALVSVYEERDVPAVGGRLVPEWVADEPDYLPAEFYWLIGVMPPTFGPADDASVGGEVRNTYGGNMSFLRSVLEDLGGFEPEIGGRTGDKNLQGEETELCARLQTEYGRGMYYTPDAIVAHKIFDYRTELGWLLDRAFWQGYSKRGLEVLVPETDGTESDYLATLLFVATPRRLRGLLTEPSLAAVVQLAMLFVFTGVVGLGYLYGAVKW